MKKTLYENGIDWKEWLSKKKEENANYCVVCGKNLKEVKKNFAHALVQQNIMMA